MPATLCKVYVTRLFAASLAVDNALTDPDALLRRRFPDIVGILFKYVQPRNNMLRFSDNF